VRRPGAVTAVAAGLAAVLVAALLAPSLLKDRGRLVGSNEVFNFGATTLLEPGQRHCQTGEAIPSAARLVRVFTGTEDRAAGPLAFTVRAGGRTVATATAAAGFKTGPVDGALRSAGWDIEGAAFCVENRGPVTITLGGSANDERNDDFINDAGRIRIEYYEPGRASPLAMAGEVVRRGALFKGAVVGPWTLWAALALTLVGGALAVVAVARGVPRAVVACVLVATLNGVAWTVLTPPFQVPDETVHVGYVQQVAETGELPKPTAGQRPSAELDVAQTSVPFTLDRDPQWVTASADRAERVLKTPLDRESEHGAGYVANNPPLYYWTEAVPYLAGSDATLYDRLMLMRLWTALMAGALAAFVLLFLREALPGRPGLALAGALAVSLHPMVGFLGGGVNPDLLLDALGACLLWLLCRGFRRGLTPGLGIAIGAVTAAGLLTKPAMLGLVPGILAGLALIAWRSEESRRPALVAAGSAVAVALVAWLGWQWAEGELFDRSTSATSGYTSTDTRVRDVSLPDLASYLWQFWLPRLPFMTEQFGSYPDYPLWETYFKGFVGRFGWFQYGFLPWVNVVALVVVVGLLALAGTTLWRHRAALRARWPELTTYALLLLGIVALVNLAGYRYRADTGFNFEQTRYLFPVVLPLYAGAVALALRALPRRWALPGAAFLLVLLAGHDLAAQLVTLERYYL